MRTFSRTGERSDVGKDGHTIRQSERQAGKKTRQDRKLKNSNNKPGTLPQTSLLHPPHRCCDVTVGFSD